MYDVENYTGVTSLLSKLKRPKDWEAIAEKYAVKHGHDAEYWLDQWKQKRELSAQFGRKYHASREEFKGEKLFSDLSTLPSGTYDELCIYSHHYRVIGKVDRVVVSGNKVSLTDIKTIENLEVEPKAYWNPTLKRKTVEKYFPPVGHLAKTKFNDAVLQLSMYAYILELYGFEIERLEIEHIKFKGRKQGYKHLLNCLEEQRLVETSKELHEAPYLKREARAILIQQKNLG